MREILYRIHNPTICWEGINTWVTKSSEYSPSEDMRNTVRYNFSSSCQSEVRWWRRIPRRLLVSPFFYIIAGETVIIIRMLFTYFTVFWWLLGTTIFSLIRSNFQIRQSIWRYLSHSWTLPFCLELYESLTEYSFFTLLIPWITSDLSISPFFSQGKITSCFLPFCFSAVSCETPAYNVILYLTIYLPLCIILSLCCGDRVFQAR